jgi:hypothetical protein
MTIKQLSERLGVSVKQLDFEIRIPCKNCIKTGGSEDSKQCGWVKGECEIIVTIRVQE